MATITLANLRTRAKQRANMENSSFLSDSEWNSVINYSISNLRDIITSKAGEDYFATAFSTSLTEGQETVNLPSDFYKLLWVEVLVDGTNYAPMRRFEIAEKPVTAFNLLAPWSEIQYRLRADTLWLQPASSTGGKTIRVWYVPVATELSADGDTLAGYNGWDEYVVVLTARKALVKEESDTSQLDQEILMFNQRIESMAPNRDQGRPMRIQDTQRNRAWGDYGLEGF